MPLSLGGLFLPLSLVAMMLRIKGPVQQFMSAGAVSPETARRPASVGVQAEYLLSPLVRRRLLVAVGDGRYYADAVRIRRRNWLLYGFCAVLAIAGAGFLLAGWLRR